MELARRAIASLLALIMVIAPVLASAKPAPPKAGNPDAEVVDVTRRAEQLLDKLEYERARELLESSVRTLAAYKKAKPASKAKLWALVGRARAELGDAVGADEAFLKAVGFDKRVKLAPGTSPKILEALERARANAPSQLEVEEDEKEKEKEKEKEPPPQKEKPIVKHTTPKDAGVVDAVVAPADAAIADARIADAGIADVGASVPDASEPIVEKPIEKPQPKITGPTLKHRIVGEVLSGRTITIVLEAEGMPKNVKLELFIRRATTSPFKQELLTKTGTTATKKIVMDRPRVELYARAVKSKKVLATLGSETDPIVISTLPPPPSLIEAWSEKETRPRFVETSSTSTASMAKSGHTKSSTVALVPPTKITKPPEDDDTLLYVGLGVGAAVVAAAVVITIVLLSKKSACDTEDGFGCVEIEIQPLLSF